MSRKINRGDIDAGFIIKQASTRERELQPYDPQGDQPQPIAETQVENDLPNEIQQQADARKRKHKSQGYESLFIRGSSSNTRQGKVVYIRSEHHDSIVKILHVIAKNDVSLFSYIDNVLEHHFATYQDDITELYEGRIEKVFPPAK